MSVGHWHSAWHTARFPYPGVRGALTAPFYNGHGAGMYDLKTHQNGWSDTFYFPFWLDCGQKFPPPGFGETTTLPPTPRPLQLPKQRETVVFNSHSSPLCKAVSLGPQPAAPVSWGVSGTWAKAERSRGKTELPGPCSRRAPCTRIKARHTGEVGGWIWYLADNFPFPFQEIKSCSRETWVYGNTRGWGNLKSS